jgi:sulfide:quinone oxidoreductase
MTKNAVPEVVVVGGGIAALELTLALRELAGDRVHITVVAPDPECHLRPLLVAEPLGAHAPRRPSLHEMAADVGFSFRQNGVIAVDAPERRVLLRGGGTLGYDSLVLAPGATRLPAFDDAVHIGDEASTAELEALRADIVSGDVRSVAFVAPTMTGWLLPLYEAALLTARLDDRVRVWLVTGEERPLALFGDEASETVARELQAAGVEFIGDHQAAITEGALLYRDAPEASIPLDRLVSLPLIRGPRLPGVPTTGVYGLIPIDDYGRVHGLADVYAVGDATDFPIKQGGIACQQAETAAVHIAARHGVPVTPRPSRPRLYATLLTGAKPIVLGPSEQRPTPGKLPGRYLAPYLASAVRSAASAV